MFDSFLESSQKSQAEFLNENHQKWAKWAIFTIFRESS